MKDSETYFKEGQNIQFQIKKQIEFSETEKYYVLEDKFGRKQLMKSEFYENYNLKIGQEINCRVDHINCSGKIFLEPEHPCYKEGDIFDFTIDKIERSENKVGENILLITVQDRIGNAALCIINDSDNQKYKIGQNISCKLERIKKGRLYLSLANQKPDADFKRGKFYRFKIEDVRTLSDNFKYYILSDEQKRTFLLKYEYYKHHEFSVGQKIECTIIKFSSKGYYILEPKHPYYEIGKEYNFEFVGQTKDTASEITGNYEITVKDIFGEELNFQSYETVINNKKPKTIRCSVSGVKKGKPLLKLRNY